MEKLCRADNETGKEKNNLPSAPNLFAPGKPSEPLGDLLRN